MKVLFVQKVKALVGSEKYFLELLPGLAEKGIRVHFVCIINAIDKEKAMPFVTACLEKKISIAHKVVNSDRSLLKILNFLKKEIDSFNPDLIHSHLIHSDFWLALIKKFKKATAPLVSTKHGYDESFLANHGFNAAKVKKNLYYRIVRFSEKYIERSYAVSKGLKNLFVEAKICRQDKIDVIHHGFDLPKIDDFNSPPIRYSENQIIIIGRIIPFKGHQHLFRAIPEIVKKIRDLSVVVLGHGDDGHIKYLKDILSENGCQEHVYYEGYQTDIYSYLLGSDVMVVPSVSEGFGLVFLEALNAKRPIVGFDVAATNEIVEDEYSGVLISPYNESEMAKEIIALLKNKTLGREMGENGYRLLKENFSLTRMVNETNQFYRDVLN